MFSTYNYRPNNRYYTHKGQIIKRTARATPNPVKFSVQDIAGLNHWIYLNNYNNTDYPSNPGDGDLTDININQITGVQLNTTNSDNQTYTVSPSANIDNFLSNSMFFSTVKGYAPTQSGNYYYTAAVITLVQKEDNSIYIGCELLSVQYGEHSTVSSGSILPSNDYNGQLLNYTTTTTNDKYLRYYFNMAFSSATSYKISPTNFYIKEVNGLTFNFGSQQLYIPLNLSVNESLITAAYSGGNALYYTVRAFSERVFLNGDLVFQDFTLATINKS